MPFIQRAQPSKPKPYVFQINSYSKGLNNVKSPFVLEINESPNMLNMMCFEDGSIETRPGIVKYLDNLLPEKIERMFSFETSTFKYFLLSSKTKLYKLDLSNNTVTQIATINDTISGFQQENSFFFVDGAKYREYDGTNIFEILDTECTTGKATAGAVNTITLEAKESAIDTHYVTYKIKIVSGTGINQTREITAYNGTTKVATITPNWTTTPDATSVYYITKTEQGITTTDNFAKTKIFSPVYDDYMNTLLGDNNIDDIKKCKKIIYHKQRMWFSNHTDYQNTMYYTDTVNPYYVPIGQWQPIISNDSDAILGCVSFNDVLVIFKKRTIHALYGFNAEDFDLKEVTVSCGAVNIDTVCKADNYLLYMGSNGHIYILYDLRTDVKKLVTKDISVDSIDIQRDPINLYSDTWDNAKAVFYDKYYLLFINGKILMYDKIGWYLWDNINPTCTMIHNNTLLLSDLNKYIYRFPFAPYRTTETWITTEETSEFTLTKSYLNDYEGAVLKVDGTPVEFDKMSNTLIKTIEPVNTSSTVTLEHLSMFGYNDNGVKYDTTWESKDLDMDSPIHAKQIKQFKITANTYKYYTSQVNVHILVDYNQINSAFTITNQISLFGVAKFGEKFVTNNIIDSKKINISKRGRIYRFKLYSNTINTPFKVYTIYGEYYIKNRGE